MSARTAAAILLLWSAACARGPAAEPVQAGVLCLHSGHPGAWSKAVQAGLRDGLGGDGGTPPDLIIEYLDGRRIQGPSYEADWWRLFAQRHAGERFAAVVAVDDLAIRSSLIHQDAELGGAPLVLCGDADWRQEPLEGRDGVTGVAGGGGLDRTVAFALRIRPSARALHVICDRGEAAAARLAALRRELARLRPGLGLVLLQDLDLERLGDRLAALPPEDAAILISYWRDGEGRFIPPGKLAGALHRSAAPILACAEWQVGEGAVGGWVAGGEALGREAGLLAGRLLAGVAAADLPVRADSSCRWVFDRQELARFAIGDELLPPGSRVLGRAEAAWIGPASAAALILLALLASGLVLRLRRAGRTRRRLADGLLQAGIGAERSDHGLARLAADGRILSANAAFRSALHRGGEVAGLQLGELAALAGAAGLAEAVAEAAAGAEVRRTLERPGAEGPHRLGLHLIPLPAMESGGARIAIECGVAADPPGRAAEAEARLAILLELVEAVLWIYDWPALTLRFASPTYPRLFARDPAELAEDPLAWLRAVHPDDRAGVRACLAGAGTSGGEPRCDFRILPADGQVRWLACRIRRMATAGEGADRLAVLVSDRSEMRAIEERMRAGQRLEAMGQLACGVAHDFNNQLAAILGYAELLSRRSEGEARRWTDSLVAAARRSASLTRQLLAFARHSEPVQMPVDIHAMIAEAIALARVGMGSGIRIVTRTDADSHTVLGDPGLLENAVFNLCLNARDAMPDGGTLTISTRTRDHHPGEGETAGLDLPAGSYLALEVADSGTGMAPEVQARLFQPFFTTKPLGKGTGLGLAVVQGVVRGMGGAVTVASSPGKGSRFTLWMPAISAAIPAGTSGPQPAGGLHGTVVLVADDESGVRSVIAEQLRLLGCTVHEAGDAEDAVVAFRRHRPALALIDMVMPGGGGSAAFAGIRTCDPDARVLVVSGYSPDGEVQRLLAAGAAGFLQKPFSGRELARAVLASLEPGRVDSGRWPPQRPSA